MKEALPAPLHLVTQAGNVLQGDLRLGGEGAAPVHGEGLGRLEPDLLPLQRAGCLLCRYGSQVDGEVHRHAGRHEALEEPWRKRAGPAAQVERPGQVSPDAEVAPVHLDLYGRVLVDLRGRAAQG